MARTQGTMLAAVAAAVLLAAGCGSSRDAVTGAAQTTCTTCHGMPPATGAHLAHVTPAASGSPAGQVLQKAFDCNQCHFKPHAVSDPGHIVQANGAAVPKPAQVRFDQPGALAGSSASFDPVSRTCSNVYCHGGNGALSRGAYTAPKWEDPPSAAACGSCHGIPPANHDLRISQLGCANCHSPSATPTGGVDPTTHIDGQFTFGTGVTGLHDLHVNSPIAAGITCGSCHGALPGTILPDFTGGKLAAATGLTPGFDPTTGKCSSTYCHGNGTTTPSATGGAAFPGLSPASVGGGTATGKTPVWGAPDGSSAQCNSCHGFPPANHDPSAIACSDCHQRTGGTGKVILDKTAHVNGTLDF